MSCPADTLRLNLTAANHVFLMEPQWNPMVEDQALDRVHRIGQTKEVTTVRYIVRNTLEQVPQHQYPVLVLGMKDLTFAKRIRHQQSKKRNLAEQAFALAKGHNDWMEVSRVYIYSNGLSINTSSACGKCFLMCHDCNRLRFGMRPHHRPSKKTLRNAMLLYTHSIGQEGLL